MADRRLTGHFTGQYGKVLVRLINGGRGQVRLFNGGKGNKQVLDFGTGPEFTEHTVFQIAYGMAPAVVITLEWPGAITNRNAGVMTETLCLKVVSVKGIAWLTDFAQCCTVLNGYRVGTGSLAHLLRAGPQHPPADPSPSG